MIAFYRLARMLGPEQPFHGFQLGHAGGLDELGSVEEVAAEFVDRMRGTLGRGPVCLIGLCFGAVVTYEMARILTDSGGEVLFLGMLDPSPALKPADEHSVTPTNVRLRRIRSVGRFLAGRVRGYSVAMQGMATGDRIRYFARKGLDIVRPSDARRRFAELRLEVAAITELNFRRELLRGYGPKPIVQGLGTLEVFKTAGRLRGP